MTPPPTLPPPKIRVKCHFPHLKNDSIRQTNQKSHDKHNITKNEMSVLWTERRTDGVATPQD